MYPAQVWIQWIRISHLGRVAAALVPARAGLQAHLNYLVFARWCVMVAAHRTAVLDDPLVTCVCVHGTCC